MTSLTTDRLLLRPLTEADLPELHRGVWSDPAVTWDGVARTPDQSRDRLRDAVEHWHRHGFGMWAAVRRDTGELCGFGGLQRLEGGDEVEVGYYLSRSCWGSGLGTEIAREALRHGFEDLHLDRVVAVVRPGNDASRRVLAKAGMRFDHQARHYDADVEVWVARPQPCNEGR
ncbi:Protein N-acetyltransferase, RimJ/RimL family [Geodermatophilus saharensis]|uniref:Protein N-acetyltransferase, RimJ/RimL family n=1 Tax=Geodermatophilus saharensis TaxID=1137994 RepID=A0A239BQ93_9ACTN|nr:Protein N-acetyltransferase, RimJ/RimL family [Geodermatophilus saharensis]